MRLTIKTETRTGKPAAQASEKQTRFAEDIINRINSALDEISALGYTEYANEAGAELDGATNMVYSGPRDVIQYLRDTTRRAVYNKCYGYARRDRNSRAVKALDPHNLEG